MRNNVEVSPFWQSCGWPDACLQVRRKVQLDRLTFRSSPSIPSYPYDFFFFLPFSVTSFQDLSVNGFPFSAEQLDFIQTNDPARDITRHLFSFLTPVIPSDLSAVSFFTRLRRASKKYVSGHFHGAIFFFKVFFSFFIIFTPNYPLLFASFSLDFIIIIFRRRRLMSSFHLVFPSKKHQILRYRRKIELLKEAKNTKVIFEVRRRISQANFDAVNRK